jgi:hypothetical protein
MKLQDAGNPEVLRREGKNLLCLSAKTIHLRQSRTLLDRFDMAN